MAQWIECVPNVSEGRRADVIGAIADAVRAVPGAHLLHVDSDVDHNRTILTFAGAPAAVAEAAFRCAAEAVARIDLTRHEGAHPRLGAADVVPFAPLEGIGVEACAQLARGVAARISMELGVPTALYGAASPDGVTLPQIRKDPPPGHPTAGVTAVGARGTLIALHVHLAGADLALGKEIARELRALPGVRAMAFELESRGCVQISINLLDWRTTPPLRVLEAVRARAEVRDCEIVGMIPRAAVEATAAAALGTGPLSVLDSAPGFLDALAQPNASPGGGAAAAHAGAMAAALVAMCCGATGAALAGERARAEVLRHELSQLGPEDAAAYAAYVKSRSQADLQRATLVPLLIAEKSAEVLLLAQRAGHQVLRMAKPDLRGAMRLATVALEQGQATARFNLGDVENRDFAAEVRARLAGIP